MEGNLNINIVDVLLQADFNLQRSKPQLGTNTYFHFPEVSKKLIEGIHKEAVKILKKRADIIETAALYEMIKVNLFAQFGKIEPILVDSVMDIYLDIVKGEEKFIGLEKCHFYPYTSGLSTFQFLDYIEFQLRPIIVSR